jgi:Carboxypeptidase regulatory-like domain
VSTIRPILFCMLLVLFGSVAAFAQQTGSITGTITDSSGAVVIGAEVAIRNLATNDSRMVESDVKGSYAATNIPAGNYEITVTKPGFKSFLVSSIELTVAQALTINPKLEPGVVAEEIQVRGDQVPDVDLEDAQVSNLVSSTQIQNLPLITRDPYSLVLLSPGTMQSNTYLGGFSVNGTRERNNNFLLDGADNNDTSVPGGPGGLVSLDPDSTQEFRIITSNFLPEYGRNNGAIVDIITKSGTNQFHGDARWFGRYNALGARDYFNHANADGTTQPMNPYVRNQFGFSVGGPIIKDKTFFFVDNEFQRYRTTLTAVSTVPSPALLSGVFNYTDPNTGVTYPIDLSSPSSPNNAQGLAMDPFIGNLLTLYPAANGPAVDGMRNLYYFPSKSAFNGWNLTSKFDHHISPSESLSLTFLRDSGSDPNAEPLLAALPGIDGYNTESTTYDGVLSLTSTLRPELVNNARFGFNVTSDNFGCNGFSTLDALGSTDQFGRGRDYIMPGLSNLACYQLGDSDGQFRRTGTWSWGDTLSWVRGAHTLKFGAEFRRIFENGYDSFSSRDSVSFAGYSDEGIPFVNEDPNNPCDPTNPSYMTNGCGSPNLQNIAAMLFGQLDNEYQAQYFDKSGNRTATDNRDFRYHEYGFFAQDTWRLRPNLTLDYGLRYEFDGVPFEANNNFSNLYQDPSGFAPFTFQVVGPGTGKLLYNNDPYDFEPRVGFSWDPFSTGKTSVRGGFGIFHDRIFGNLLGNARGNPPFQQTVNNYYYYPTPSQPFPLIEATPLPATLPTSAEVDQFAFITPDLFANNIKMPYSENWNLGIQRELASNLTIEINYVGSRGFRLWRVVDGNPPQPALVSALLADGVPPDLLTGSLLWYGGDFGYYPFDATNNNAFLQADYNESSAHSLYNAAQVNITKRMSNGFQIQGAYTWAHAIDDAPDPLAPGEGAFSHVFPRNSFNLAAERGNSDFDVRNRFVFNYSWDLPFGHGKQFMNSGFAGKVLEGWQLSGITTLQTGLHYSVYGYVDSQHTGLSDRADYIGPNTLPAGHPRTETGLPLSAFALPAYGTAGDSGRNNFTGPGLNNWNMVMSKTMSFNDRFNLQLRCEAYNVFNRTEFDLPDGLMADTNTFGFSTSTLLQPDGTTTARQLQFGAKLQF